MHFREMSPSCDDRREPWCEGTRILLEKKEKKRKKNEIIYKEMLYLQRKKKVCEIVTWRFARIVVNTCRYESIMAGYKTVYLRTNKERKKKTKKKKKKRKKNKRNKYIEKQTLFRRSSSDSIVYSIQNKFLVSNNIGDIYPLIKIPFYT